MKIPKPQDMIFLIVDDMDNMRRSIRAMLKLIQYGKEHYEAANGKEAWEMLSDESARFDFIISDWNMPKMNGTELLNLTRQSKKYRDTPFLMITAETNQSIVAEAAEHDVDAYLTKPFVTATLEQKIKELLHNLAHPSPLNAFLKKAREQREKGDIDGAIKYAREAVKLNPRSSRPLRELGQLFLKKGDLKNSTTCFLKATELNRLDVPSYHFLGQIYLKTGNIDKAIVYYSRAMELSPRHSDRAFKFAKLLLDKKKLHEAEKILKLMIRNNENDMDLHEDIAETCLDYGLYNLAASTYRRVFSAAPDRGYLRKKLGVSLQLAGQHQEAIQVLEKAVEKTPEDIELLLALAKTYMDVKMPMRADKWATRVIRLDPSNHEAREILDKCL